MITLWLKHVLSNLFQVLYIYLCKAPVANRFLVIVTHPLRTFYFNSVIANGMVWRNHRLDDSLESYRIWCRIFTDRSQCWTKPSSFFKWPANKCLLKYKLMQTTKAKPAITFYRKFDFLIPVDFPRKIFLVQMMNLWNLQQSNVKQNQ